MNRQGALSAEQQKSSSREETAEAETIITAVETGVLAAETGGKIEESLNSPFSLNVKQLLI